jgi:hypothetical protein
MENARAIGPSLADQNVSGALAELISFREATLCGTIALANQFIPGDQTAQAARTTIPSFIR